MASERLKNSLRLWVEKQRQTGDPVGKFVARFVWFTHVARHFLPNVPRYIRIWLRLKLGISFSKTDSKIVDRGRWPKADGDAVARLREWENVIIEESVTWAERKAAASDVAALVRKVVPNRYDGNSDRMGVFDVLKRDGILRIPELQFSAEKVREIRAYLDHKPIFAAHVPIYSDGIPRRLSDPEARRHPFGSYDMSDVVKAPHLLELAFEPKLLAVVEKYLGCAPSIFSLHAWWSFPSPSVSGPQTFHRDLDDFNFLSLFVFLTDVRGGEHGGEHDFIVATHSWDTVTETLGGDETLASEFFYPKSTGTIHEEESLYRQVFGDKVRTIVGEAGSVFLADTYGLHRGVRPTKEGRLVCWIRYGVRKNHAYRHMQSKPHDFDWGRGRIPDDSYTRYVGRLLLK